MVGNGQKPIYHYTVQGQNEFKIIARERIDNISVKIIDYRNPKKTSVVTNWDFDCRTITNHTRTLDLDMYGFTHPWQDADDLISLSIADTTAISNAISNDTYYIEYEDEQTFGSFHTNAYSNSMLYMMAKRNINFEELIDLRKTIQKKLYWGSARKSFQKYNVDYRFTISPFNPKVVYVDFTKNGVDHPLYELKSVYSSDDAFNYDRRADAFSFYRKNGKWWGN